MCKIWVNEELFYVVWYEVKKQSECQYVDQNWSIGCEEDRELKVDDYFQEYVEKSKWDPKFF